MTPGYLAGISQQMSPLELGTRSYFVHQPSVVAKPEVAMVRSSSWVANRRVASTPLAQIWRLSGSAQLTETGTKMLAHPELCQFYKL